VPSRADEMGRFLQALADAAPHALSGEATLPLDQPQLATLLEVFDHFAAPDMECRMVASPGVPALSFTGSDGLRQAWADWLGGFKGVRFEFEELLQAEESVVLLAKQIGTTRYGVELEQPSAMVATFGEDGRLQRLEFHLDRAEAMRSAGLEA
jgi:hypothetical protein